MNIYIVIYNLVSLFSSFSYHHFILFMHESITSTLIVRKIGYFVAKIKSIFFTILYAF